MCISRNKRNFGGGKQYLLSNQRLSQAGKTHERRAGENSRKDYTWVAPNVQNHAKAALSLRRYRHLPQGLNSLLERRMGAEQRGYATAAEHRLHDAQRGGR